jgi:sulfate transport system permease protein
LITGNIPFKTEVSSVFIRSQIESGNEAGAAAVSVVLLTVSLVLLAAVTVAQRWGSKGSGQ